MTMLALAVAGAIGCAGDADTGEACIAQTTLGRIIGTRVDQTCGFFGVPYAAPPIGDLRFRPPAAVAPWGELVANDRARVCPQYRSSPEEYPDDREVFADEDCLYLNAWTPRTDAARRPVMVFVHGGAGRIGTANEAMYDGHELARRGDVVVVTLNYRLGMLGWTELGGLDAGYAGSGNNGLRDQLAALAWVRDHVADLGGDPDNVTVFGQSLGAVSISAMLATERPRRWMHRAILESGSGYLVHPRAVAEGFAQRFLGNAGISSLAELAALTTEQLLAAQDLSLGQDAGLLPAIAFAPYIDGDLVLGPVLARLANGDARDIDLLVGNTRDEMRFFGLIDPHLFEITQDQYSPLFLRRSAMRATRCSPRTPRRLTRARPTATRSSRCSPIRASGCP
jgi:para-nitrobenzyl esterase